MLNIQNEIFPVVALIFYLAVAIPINYFFARFADRWFGYFIQWLIVLTVLPFASHGALWLLYRHRIPRGNKPVQVRLARDEDSAQVINTEVDYFVIKADPDGVTPFADVEVDREEPVVGVLDVIPEHLRDRHVEELIEWDQLSHAGALAESRLKDAREKGHDELVKVYESYMDIVCRNRKGYNPLPDHKKNG